MKARERAKAHYRKNHAQKLAYAKRYREEKKEQVSAKVKEWADKHRAELKAYKQQYGAGHGKKTIQRYRRAHAEKTAAYQAAYVAENRDSILRQRRAYAKTDRGRAVILNSDHKRRAAINSCEHPATAEEVGEFLKRSMRCLYCGRTDRKITLDHFMPIVKGGEHSIENFAAACKPCNSKKKDKHPECFLIEIGLIPNPFW